MPKQRRSEKFRFDLPAVIDPEEDWCIVVQIPGHADYLAALIGQLSLLTRSENFARDDSLTGAAETARRWRDALFSQPIERCDMFDLREKPGYPYIMQASTDGGETWHDAYNGCACVGGIPVFYPDTSTSEARADVSAAIIQKFLEWLAQYLADAIGESATKEDTLDGVMAFLTPYGAGGTVRAQIASAWDAMVATDEGERADYYADCMYLDEFNGLKAHIEGNPDNWLDGLAGWLFNWLNESSDALYQTLNAAAAAMGGNQLWNFVQANGGSGGGAGFGADCVWSYDMQLTVNSYAGFYRHFTECGGMEYGVWTSGRGYEAEDGVSEANCTTVKERLYYSIELDGFTCTGIDLTSARDSATTDFTFGIELRDETGSYLGNPIHSNDNSVGTKSASFTQEGVYQLFIYIDNADGEAGKGTRISNIVVHGSGQKPSQFV